MNHINNETYYNINIVYYANNRQNKKATVTKLRSACLVPCDNTKNDTIPTLFTALHSSCPWQDFSPVISQFQKSSDNQKCQSTLLEYNNLIKLRLSNFYLICRRRQFLHFKQCCFLFLYSFSIQYAHQSLLMRIALSFVCSANYLYYLFQLSEL